MEQIKSIIDLATGSGIGIIDVIGILSVIAAFTPTPKDDLILVALRKILNLGAMNFGQSENKVKPGEK